MVQFHPEGESPYAYKFAAENSHWIENDSNVYITLLKQIDTLNMNKYSYTCNEDSQNNFMNCVENYYSKRLGCLLPWSIKDNQKNNSDNVCKGKDKFKEYKNISMNIPGREETKDLIKEGCLIPNCQQRSWDVKQEKFNDVQGAQVISRILLTSRL